MFFCIGTLFAAFDDVLVEGFSVDDDEEDDGCDGSADDDCRTGCFCSLPIVLGWRRVGLADLS